MIVRARRYRTPCKEMNARGLYNIVCTYVGLDLHLVVEWYLCDSNSDL